MVECLEIHRLVFYGNQQFEEGYSPIEHSCEKKKKKLKCRTLIEPYILGELKYRDKKGSKYPDIESFHNWTSLPEIKIQESQRNRKGNTLFYREEQKNLTRENYQAKKEEEDKKEKCKNEGHKERRF